MTGAYPMARTSENRVKTTIRVARSTPERLKAIAYKLGYIYNKKGATGELLDAIARGDIILTVIRPSGNASHK